MSLANLIDHTLLKPDCNPSHIKQLCKDALHQKFAAVCIPPYFVQEAKILLANSAVKVATVVGFPMGYAATVSKVEEIKRALDEGADELDVVANICAIKSKNWNYVKNDIDSCTRAVHLKGKSIKLILEATLLSEEEISKVCEICKDSGVNFVKTSTGYHGGATVEVVELLRSLLPKSIKIKASGGIRTREQAEKMVAAGAARIGTSAGIAIVQG